MRPTLALVFIVVTASCAAPDQPPPDDNDDERVPAVIDPACDTPGCVRAATSLGRFARAQIAPLLQDGVVLENGYEVFTVEYFTEGGPATATVTLPLDLEGEAPAEGFSVVANAHGTVGLDDPCRLSDTVSGSGLAGLFGARRAIGVAPDYPGIGSPGLHAYLSTRSEGTSTLDAIRAALNLAEIEGVPSSGRAAVVGNSQGGHAMFAAAALHEEYAPDLDMRAFAASAPASVYVEHWAGGVQIAGPHLALHAMLVYSAAAHAGALDDDLWAQGFADRADEILTTRCLWSPDLSPRALLTDADGVPTTPSEVFSAEMLDGFPSFPFLQDFYDENRVRPFSQTAPIAIFQGTEDDVVLPFMTNALVDDLRAGGMEIELFTIEGGTHIDTAFGFLAINEVAMEESIAWVRDRLE